MIINILYLYSFHIVVFYRLTKFFVKLQLNFFLTLDDEITVHKVANYCDTTLTFVFSVDIMFL